MQYKHAMILYNNNNAKADFYQILNPGRAHVDLSACIVPLDIHRKP